MKTLEKIGVGDMPADNILKIDAHRNFPSGPGTHHFTAGGMGSIPGTKIPGASRFGQEKKRKKERKEKHSSWPLAKMGEQRSWVS